MEFRIDDLFFNVNADEVVIESMGVTSVNRIKELTSAKIHSAYPTSIGRVRRIFSKSILVAILVFLFATVALASTISCIHKIYILRVCDDGQIIPNEPPDLGIEFSVQNICPTGMELICSNHNENYSRRLITGNQYIIEKKTGFQWEPINTLSGEYVTVLVDTDISEIGTYIWELDWSDIYGDLPPGYYRLCKHVIELNDRNISKSREYHIEFIIGGDS